HDGQYFFEAKALPREKRDLSDANDDSVNLPVNSSDEVQVNADNQSLSASGILNKRHKAAATEPISSWEEEKRNRRGATSISNMVDQFSNNLNLSGPYFPTPMPSPPITSASSFQADPGEFQQDTNVLLRLFKSSDETVKTDCKNLIQESINQFNADVFDLPTLQELVVFSTIPDKDIFLRIIQKLLQVLESSHTFPIMLPYGLAVILSTYPEKLDLANVTEVLTSILTLIQNAFLNNNDNLQRLPLLQAFSALLDVMVLRKVVITDTDSQLDEKLQDLKRHKDATISFISSYTL
ncbi:hypothetical protein BGZ76_007181, partial [Entomortierella beljakovae]